MLMAMVLLMSDPHGVEGRRFAVENPDEYGIL
jgi:hypothetical protein